MSVHSTWQRVFAQRAAWTPSPRVLARYSDAVKETATYAESALHGPDRWRVQKPV